MNVIDHTALYLKRNILSYISLFSNLDITHLGYFIDKDREGVGITIESLDMNLEISIEILFEKKIVINIMQNESLIKTEVVPFLQDDKATFDLIKSFIRSFVIPYR
jgi:hypothetical protein